MGGRRILNLKDTRDLPHVRIETWVATILGRVNREMERKWIRTSPGLMDRRNLWDCDKEGNSKALLPPSNSSLVVDVTL